MEIIFPFMSHDPKTPMPVVNNLIRSKYLAKHWLISLRPRQGSEQPDAYGER